MVRQLRWDFKQNTLTAANQMVKKLLCRVHMFIHLIMMKSLLSVYLHTLQPLPALLRSTMLESCPVKHVLTTTATAAVLLWAFVGMEWNEPLFATCAETQAKLNNLHPNTSNTDRIQRVIFLSLIDVGFDTVVCFVASQQEGRWFNPGSRALSVWSVCDLHCSVSIQGLHP